MADSKISQLTSGAPAQAGDEYVVARSGANYKLTLTNIAGNMPATTISSGNLTFSSTAQRITGDMTNATIANRLAFQTSTTNGNTIVSAIPNGTAVTSVFRTFNDSNPTNAGQATIGLNNANAFFDVGITGTGSYLPLAFATGGSERMRLDTSGNVGIGASSVLTGLQVSKGASEPSGELGTLLVTGSSTAYRLAMGYSSTNNAGWIQSVHNGVAQTSLLLNPGGGNVGIGTASPGTKLTVSSATNAGISVTDGTVTTIMYNSTGGVGSIGTTSNHPVDFYANNAARMRIDSSGNVGIGGTASSGTRLLAAASSTATANYYDGARVVFQNTSATNNNFVDLSFVSANGNDYAAIWGICSAHTAGATTGSLVFGTTNAGAAATERMRITSDGEVYIAGTTDQGAYNLQCNGTGVWGAGAYVNGSDARLKDNIQSLDAGLDVVKAMRPVTFQYKPDYSKDQSVQPGFIAQELQTAMAGKPYLEGVVQEGPNHLNVAYQNIIPILVKAIQELEAKVAALEAK